jgi:hypothetical protein
MRISARLQRAFWFLSRQARATRRWGQAQKLQPAEAFDRVVAAGSLRAAQAVLDRQRADDAALRDRQRRGLLGAAPVAAARPSAPGGPPDLTALLAFLAANPEVAAALRLDVTTPEPRAVQFALVLDDLLKAPIQPIDLDRPPNPTTSGARLSSSR